jgi:reactive intermediate/imine deaminase
MSQEPIFTTDAPAAIGAYSQAMRCGDFLFVSGQIPLDPKTMELVGSDAKDQIEQLFRNLEALSLAAEGRLGNICKLTLYLTDLNHFSLVNEAMERWFTPPFPARAVVEVSALPREAKVEADAILYLPQQKLG